MLHGSGVLFRGYVSCLRCFTGGGGGGLYAATGNRTRLYNEGLTVNIDAEYFEPKAIEWRNLNYEFQTYKCYIFLCNISCSFRCVPPLPLDVIYRFLRNFNPKMRTACFSGKFLTIYQTTRCPKPEKHNKIYRC